MQDIPNSISIPYKKGTLDDAQLNKKMTEWVEYGTCEQDCADKIAKVLPAIAQGSLKGKWFVLLGAGSELGPLKVLLSYGANVIAVRTRKKQGWVTMGEVAKNSPGTLFIPLSKTVDEEGNTQEWSEEWSDNAGCDILTETLDIRDWIIDVLGGPNTEVEPTVGCYTYLDSEAHVRVTLGCDVIMTGLEFTFPKTKLAYIGSTSDSTAITHDMKNA